MYRRVLYQNFDGLCIDAYVRNSDINCDVGVRLGEMKAGCNGHGDEKMYLNSVDVAAYLFVPMSKVQLADVTVILNPHSMTIDT